MKCKICGIEFVQNGRFRLHCSKECIVKSRQENNQTSLELTLENNLKAANENWKKVVADCESGKVNQAHVAFAMNWIVEIEKQKEAIAQRDYEQKYDR